MKKCCIVVMLLSIAVPARAQEPTGHIPDTTPRLIISERAIAAAIEENPPAQPARGRDSVANGALLGGILAAGVMMGGGAYLCNELREEGDPSCTKSVITVGAISFVIGAAVGAGVDALFSRSTPAQPFGPTAPPSQ